MGNLPHLLLDHPAVLFLAWSLFLAGECLFLGPLSYVPLADYGENNLPARLAAIMAWHDGQIGFWFPQALSGADRLAMGLQNKSDLLLFAVFPGWLAHGLVMWIQRFVSGYFMFRLLADRFAAGWLPSLSGGLFYSLFSQPALNHQWAGFSLYDGLALPALPFVIWCLGRLMDGRNRKGIVLAALLGAAYSLVSHFFYTVFVLPMIVLWFFLIERRSVGCTSVLVAFAAGWLTVEAPFLWAAAANAPFSHRKQRVVHSVLDGSGTHLWLSALDLAAAFVRDNLAVLAAAVAGLAAARGNERRLAWLLGLAMACLAGVVLETLLMGGVLYRAGFFQGFDFKRMYILFPFLSIVAGSLGLASLPERWQVRPSEIRWKLPPMKLRAFFCLALMGLVVGQSLAVKKKALAGVADGNNYSNLFRHSTLEKLQHLREELPPFRVATAVGHLATGPFPGSAWAYGLETADGYIPLFTERYHRFWQGVISPLGSLEPSRHERFRKGDSRAYLFIPPAVRHDGGAVSMESFARVDLLSLANVRFILSAVPLEGPGLKTYSTEGIGLQGDGTARPRRDPFRGFLLGEHPGTTLYVYENGNVLPRFFLTRQIRSFEEPQGLLEALESAPLAELRTTAFVLRSDMEFSGSIVGGKEPGEVAIRSYHPDRVELQVDAPSDSVLIVTNSFSPWWHVSIDGTRGRVFPVDHAFQGVALSRGMHRVILTYEPPYSFRGSWGP